MNWSFFTGREGFWKDAHEKQWRPEKQTNKQKTNIN